MENNQLNSDSLNLESSDNTNVLSMSTVEKQHIIKVLNYTKGNKAEAARFLDIGIATLYRKIEEFGLK